MEPCYYVYLENESRGPFSMDDLRKMPGQAGVTDETPCCQAGSESWSTISEILNGSHPPELPVAPVSTHPKPNRLDSRYDHLTYVVRRKILKLFGGAFHIFGPSGEVCFFSELKAFKLKEDIRIYSDESKSLELLSIRARNIIDFGATYDVFDSTDGASLGALRRKGFKSMIQDEWAILDTQDSEIGIIKEDSLTLALIRRFLTNLVPQNYDAEIRGSPVCEFRQNFNPFVMKVTLDFSRDTGDLLDRRLGIAAAILLCGIEGKQD